MPLGERIRELREKRDMSLRELAKKAQCSAAFLSDIELGRRYPSEANLKDLAKLLGVPYDELKTHDSRPPLEEMKKLTASDPLWAVAFRTMIDRKLTAEELLKAVESKRPPQKKQR